jgi:serine/threonine-protein kinase
VSFEPEIVPGTILAGKYRVERVLGHGGMGLVFAAQHLALAERVAIKVLSYGARVSDEALARLQREARILARVRNEHVVRVIDLGTLEGGCPFIVMEYLDGRDLGSWLDEQGRFAPELAVGVVLQACVALAAAHNKGVVHRDLKPENLFCSRHDDGGWLIKVLDFGISRLEREGSGDVLGASVTSESTVIGTPLYMSPEQLRSAKAVDCRSDIWSLGVVLFELLTGAPPFTGASFGDMAIKIATEKPRAPEGLDPPLDPALAAVVLRCLEKEREHRFQNVAELARALCPFGPPRSELIAERVERILLVNEPVAADAGDSSVTLTKHQSARAGSQSPLTRSRALTALAVVAALAVAALSLRMLRPAPAEHRVFIGTTAVSPEVPAAPILSSPAFQSDADASRESFSNVQSPTPVGSASSGAKTVRVVPNTKVLCNPPYTIDAQGRKKFRHECFIDRRSR